ncbi:MAG: hypothetical protein M1272_04195 [Firmicutes bacterium]|nr:hypothetical protein [Bacillota bacterium]
MSSRSRVALLTCAGPILAFVASFMPWVHLIGPSRTTAWDVYQLSPAAWVWLICDGALVVTSVRWLHLTPPRWWSLAWQTLGAISLGVALTGMVFVQVAAHVSATLGAPPPLAPDYGAYVFAAAAFLWTATPWILMATAEEGSIPGSRRRSG